jgi:phage-related minor tail protein
MAGGRFGVMGEAGPEAIVPLKRSASGDLGVRSSPVNITVINQAGVKVETTEKEDPNGRKEIMMLIRKEVTQGLNDGSFDRALRANFGTTRQGY